MRANHFVHLLAVSWVAILGCVGKPDRPADAVDAFGADVATLGDGGIDHCEPTACGAAGGACQAGACEIPSTFAGVTCPSGMPCRVHCIGKDACKPGVSCGGATWCDVRCDGDSACPSGVDCGMASTCIVGCRGVGACKHGSSLSIPAVQCRDASCDVTCTGDSACGDGIEANGSCQAHCCDGACAGGVGTCSVDSTCS